MLKFLLLSLTSLFALHLTTGQFFPRPPNGLRPPHGSRPPPNGFGYGTEIPWLVSVQVHAWHSCGGVILAPQWVLIAASCTNGLIAKSLTVRVGSRSNKRGGSVIQVNQIVQPDEYDSPNHDYDFSLLELAEPLNFTSTIQSIALPNATDTVEDGSSCLVVGWGDTKNIKAFGDSFHVSIIPVVNRETCQEIYESIHNITDRMICAGSGDAVKVTCRGDEGSPLVCGYNSTGSNTLTGIVSWAEGCGDLRYPGVYARVQAVLPWIQNITGI